MTPYLRLPMVAVVVLALASVGFAQEVMDQQNDPEATQSFSCGTPPILNGTILQSFVPTHSRLTAVELRLRAGGAFPSTGVSTTARIRSGASDGEILAEAAADVAGPQAAGTQLLVRFDFSGVELTPGETYLIEWVTPVSSTLSWVGSAGDPYPAGTAFSCIGNPWPGGETDFNFTTFAISDALTPKERIVALHSRVVAELSGPGSRCLDRLLHLACRCLEKGKPHLAILKLRVFRWKVYMLARVGLVSSSTALELIGEAGAIVSELRTSLPAHPGRWWRS